VAFSGEGGSAPRRRTSDNLRDECSVTWTPFVPVIARRPWNSLLRGRHFLVGDRKPLGTTPEDHVNHADLKNISVQLHWNS